jgi:Fibronectin type III-like domain
VITSSSSTSHTVTFVVQNAGTRAGTEIVQLCIGFPPAAGEPPKLLRGFEVVDLAPGVQSIVTFPLVEKVRGLLISLPLFVLELTPDNGVLCMADFTLFSSISLDVVFGPQKLESCEYTLERSQCTWVPRAGISD